MRDLTERADSDAESETGDGTSFILLESVGEASETQLLMLQGVAFSLNELRTMAMKEAPQTFDLSLEDMKDRIIRICNDQGPTLTEDAWGWIDREEDRDLLILIMFLMLIRKYEQTFWNIRKGMLENRELCIGVLEMTRDKELLANIAKRIKAEKEKESEAEEE